MFVYLTSFILTSISLAHDGYELKVSVKNIETQRGKIRICLANERTDFLKACFLSKEETAVGKVVTAVFQHVPPGEYAVSVYHDEDGNGELNKKGPFGIPSEAYGFSNNPRAYFGPPDYEDCTFQVSSDKVIVINL